MNTNPSDEKLYSEEASKARELRSSLQSMRDRLMAVLPQKFGDAFDGDMDTLLEAANYLGRAALRTASQPATPASASEAECALGGSHDWRGDGLCDRCGATLHQPPSGEWVMVPREPTIAMIVAAVKSQEGDAVYKCVSGEGLYNMEEEARCAYRAMIAAAPSQE